MINGSWGKWVLEVKTGAFDSTDLRGLLEFSSRYPAFRPLVLCDDDYRMVAERLGVAAMDWRSYLIEGIPRNPG